MKGSNHLCVCQQPVSVCVYVRATQGTSLALITATYRGLPFPSLLSLLPLSPPFLFSSFYISARSLHFFHFKFYLFLPSLSPLHLALSFHLLSSFPSLIPLPPLCRMEIPSRTKFAPSQKVVYVDTSFIFQLICTQNIQMQKRRSESADNTACCFFPPQHFE